MDRDCLCRLNVGHLARAQAYGLLHRTLQSIADAHSPFELVDPASAEDLRPRVCPPLNQPLYPAAHLAVTRQRGLFSGAGAAHAQSLASRCARSEALQCYTDQQRGRQKDPDRACRDRTQHYNLTAVSGGAHKVLTRVSLVIAQDPSAAVAVSLRAKDTQWRIAEAFPVAALDPAHVVLRADGSVRVLIPAGDVVVMSVTMVVLS